MFYQNSWVFFLDFWHLDIKYFEFKICSSSGGLNTFCSRC
jgi:hypothetical protein